MTHRANDIIGRTGALLLLTVGLWHAAPALGASSLQTEQTIKGVAPVLKAPSNGLAHAVDFSGTYAVANKLSTGDTIVMKYNYIDDDGDGDDSAANTRVVWKYTPFGGGADVIIPSTGVAATASTPGKSTIVLPGAAIRATALKVTIEEYSKSGDPRNGQAIVVTNTGLNTAPGGGGGGGTATNPVPVEPGSNAVPGIYLSTDSTFASNLVNTPGSTIVGLTYVFKLWDTSTGPVGSGATDITSRVPNYNWRFVGRSWSDNRTAPAGGFPTNVVNRNYTIPINTGPAGGTALTGSADGVQGFNLAVDY